MEFLDSSTFYTQFLVRERHLFVKRKVQRFFNVDDYFLIKSSFYFTYFMSSGLFVNDNDIDTKNFERFCSYIHVCISLIQRNIRRRLHNRAVKRVMTFDEASKEVLPEVLLTVIRSYL